MSERDFTIAMLRQAPSSHAPVTGPLTGGGGKDASLHKQDGAKSKKTKKTAGDALATTETVVGAGGGGTVTGAGQSVQFAGDRGTALSDRTRARDSNATASILYGGGALQAGEGVKEGSYQILVLLDRDSNLRFAKRALDMPKEP